MEVTMLNLIFATSILAGVNIILGSVDAIFNGSFDKKKFIKGIGKASVIVGCVFAGYYAGNLVPDIMVMKVDETDINLMTAIHLSGVTVFGLYAKQFIDKLMSMLTK